MYNIMYIGRMKRGIIHLQCNFKSLFPHPLHVFAKYSYLYGIQTIAAHDTSHVYTGYPIFMMC